MTAERDRVPLRVLLVDDQRLVRSGFAMILSAEDDIVVVGEAENGRAAVEMARAERPDVILMDVQMPVLDGISATREIVAADLGRVLILTTFDRDDYLFAALEAGASGFLLKNSDPDRLVEAIIAVGDGHALLSPEVTRRVIEQMTSGAPPVGSASGMVTTADADGADDVGADGVGVRGARSAAAAGTASAGSRRPGPRDKDLARLTEREREVFELVGHGLSNAEIAARLYLGEATVKTHVSSCLAKLHLRDRVQAVVLAYEVGIITPAD